jgi:hypothetical protein
VVKLSWASSIINREGIGHGHCHYSKKRRRRVHDHYRGTSWWETGKACTPTGSESQKDHDQEKNKKKGTQVTLLGPYNVSVSCGPDGNGKIPNNGHWIWGGGGFLVDVSSPEDDPNNKGKKDLPKPSVHIGWDPGNSAVQEGAKPTGGGDTFEIGVDDQEKYEKAFARAFGLPPAKGG